MANTKLSGLNSRGTPDRANDLIYVANGGTSYKSTVNNELGISGNPVGDTDSQTLTNKTLTSPTINGATLSGTLSGTYTLGGTPTFPASVATLTSVQTLTNKTLTSPTINSPTITNASITADSITGFTTSNTGTIYGVAVTSGALSGASLTANTVPGTALNGTYRQNTQAVSSNTTQTALIYKDGWNYLSAASGSTASVAITFPTAFPTAVVNLEFGTLGFKATTPPTVITDFNSALGGETYASSATAISTTGFTFNLFKSAAYSSATNYYGFWWRAIGN